MSEQEQMSVWEKYWKIGVDNPQFNILSKFEELGFTVYDEEPDSDIMAIGTYGRVRQFIKDGRLYVLKEDLKQNFYEKKNVAPPPVDVTFEQYINDIKNMSSTNPMFVKFLHETELVMVFSLVEGYVRLTPAHFVPDVSFDLSFALREFAKFFATHTAVRLKTWHPQYLFYNPLTKNVKIADISAVWYVPLSPEHHFAMMPVALAADNIVIYGLINPLTRDQLNSVAMIRRDVYLRGIKQPPPLIYL